MIGIHPRTTACETNSQGEREKSPRHPYLRRDREPLWHDWWRGDFQSAAATGVIFDAVGNLYGTTNQGGVDQAYYAGGTVFEISP